MSLPDPTVLALNFGSASLKAATFAVRMGHASQGHAPELLERVSVESASDRFQARDDDAARLLEGVIDKFKRMEAAPVVIEAPYFEVNFDFRLDPVDAGS